MYVELSGAITSGLGYAIWYTALRRLSPTQGASVQLSEPVLTASAGTVLLGEPMTVRGVPTCRRARLLRGCGELRD